MKKCDNCAWYCHFDGRCYGNGAALCVGQPFAIKMDAETKGCSKWESDGLEDWEREACKPETLMAMEKKTCFI